jgi:peptidyl-prolyl cis-trans isomerase B (cyclophilin B)
MMRWAVLAALVLALAGCGGDGDADESEAEATTPTQTEAAAPAGGCRDVELPSARADGNEQPPEAPLAETKTYRVIVKTNCGDFTITLDPKASPRTVASFVALAQNDFFDATFFHRIVPGFVIQGGDPTGKGTGGPGYSTVDTPAAATRYTRGVVAMAKAGAEEPGTAGSQFFVVTADDAGLPPEYAVIGRVTGGEDVVARIAVLGDPTTEFPTQPVVITDMVVEVE